jgi:exodeoxyribonuclease-3
VRVATWNVNSVRQRIGHLVDYLAEVKPDALCLQELKCQDEQFPRAEVEALGYNVAVHGQKGFNGVAILCKGPFEATRGLPGDETDVQSRYIEGVLPFGREVLRVASIYLPNGNPIGTEKFSYKLGFMDRLIRHARRLLDYEEPLVLAGDFNVIPEPRDAAHPEAWLRDALFQPESRAKFRELLALGFRRAARVERRRRPLHVLGLPGRLLAARQRHPHRSPAAVAARRRPAARRHDRQGDARPREAVGPCADPGRPRRVTAAASGTHEIGRFHVFARKVDEFAVRRMVGRFDAFDFDRHLGVNALDMLDELVLFAGRADDEDRAGVGDGLRDILQKCLILRGMVVIAVRMAMQIAHGTLGADDQLFRLAGAEVKDAGAPVIDPDDGMVMALHCFPPRRPSSRQRRRRMAP